jgi:hypothetical protein
MFLLTFFGRQFLSGSFWPAFWPAFSLTGPMQGPWKISRAFRPFKRGGVSTYHSYALRPTPTSPPAPSTRPIGTRGAGDGGGLSYEPAGATRKKKHPLELIIRSRTAGQPDSRTAGQPDRIE